MRVDQQENNTTTTQTMTTTQQQSDLSLSITTEFRETTLHKQQLYTLVTLEAPEYESEERGSRAPIDIVCVIDVSGSMAGEKMTLMKKTLLFMIEQLKEEDKLSLVLFDTYVTNALPLVKMNEEGKKRAIETVDAIRAGSSTNLSGGLLEGLTVIKNRELPADVSSVLLFTDGLANHGITKSGPLVAAAHSVLQTITKAVSVFTFGFGKDHDANMLTEISQAGNGLYYFLETVEAIPETFGDCLGGLLSVIGQNIKVQIETLENGCEISKIHSAYKQNEIRKDHSIELVLGDIYSEEKKNIIFELSIPELRAPMDSQDLVRVTLNYFNVITNTLKSVSQFVSVARLTTVPENRETNPILDKQRNRVECANAMQRARDLGNNNQLEEARKIIKLEMERNSTSATAQDDFCRGLVNDLQDCLGDMNDRNAYQQLASKKLNNYWGSSNYERSTNSKSAAQTSYGTKAKMSRKKAATDQML